MNSAQTRPSPTFRQKQTPSSKIWLVNNRRIQQASSDRKKLLAFRNMRYKITLLMVLIAVASCTPKKEELLSDSDAELLASVKKVQKETGLSNEQMESAIIRGAKVLSILDNAFREGLLTEEEFERMPAMMKEVEENMRESDAMAAAVSLAVLRSNAQDEPDKALPMLRYMVANHYNNLIYDKKADKSFVEKVDEYAKNDPELDKMLEK